MRHIHRRFCIGDVKLTELCAMHPIPGIAELCAAIETDLICSPCDSKHTADLVVMAPEQPTERRFHMVRNLSRSDRTKSDRCGVSDLSRKAHAATRQSGLAFRFVESARSKALACIIREEPAEGILGDMRSPKALLAA